MLNGLDLFSGIGGISEAIAPWVRTIAYCEREPKSIAILLSRMGRGEIDNAPIWDDVFTLSRSQLDVEIDVISGGFPCTDISLAGLRKGLAADRSGLFWEIVRLTKEIRPKIVFLENVYPGIKKYVPTIRNQFESLGYVCRDGFLAASDIGAKHQRKRWFFVAYSNQERIRQQPARIQNKILTDNIMENGENTHADEERFQRQRITSGISKEQSELTSLLESDSWDELANFFCRMDHGLQFRRYARGALGDSVVPNQVRYAFETLTGLKLGVKNETNQRL